MNIVKENIDALNAVLTVTVEKVDYESKVEAKLRDYRRKVQMPGFRPGMVPMGLIKKMYQNPTAADEIFKLVSDLVGNYINDNHLYTVGRPIPSGELPSIDLSVQTDFEFKYEIGLAPKVNLTVSSEIKIPYYTITIPDEDVQARIDAYRRYYGKTVSAEQIGSDDLVIVDLAQSGEKGLTVEKAMLSLKVIPEAEQQALLGLSVGASVEADVRKMLTNDVDCAAFLKIPTEQLAEVDPVFTITIKEITRVEPSEINQEFFDSVYGKDVITSEEEFVSRIKSDMGSELANKSNRRFRVDVRNTLLQEVTLELPEVFLKRWLAYSSDGKMTEEEAEKEFPHIAGILRWNLIKEHILQQQNIEVTEEALLDTAKKVVLERLAMYGIGSMNEERLTEFAQSTLERSNEERNQIVDYTIETLAVEYIRNTATIEHKEVSNKQFNEII
ncbi:MAG: trigger factor [Prevotellaceae bacterium]|jgi:trigger factor|nr:trigger factor [Prevotellaceae bacterium]